MEKNLHTIKEFESNTPAGVVFEEFTMKAGKVTKANARIKVMKRISGKTVPAVLQATYDGYGHCHVGNVRKRNYDVVWSI